MDLSTEHHPQIDRQSERTIQVLEDMFYYYVLDFGGNRDEYIPLVEFTYNNSYQASICMAPYEAIYGKWNLKIVQRHQKSYVDLNRREVEFDIGDYVFLNVSPMHGIIRFGIKGKLALKYVESFEIVEEVDDIAYRLNLPPQLDNIYNVFESSMLKYIPDPSHVLPYAYIPL